MYSAIYTVNWGFNCRAAANIFRPRTFIGLVSCPIDKHYYISDVTMWPAPMGASQSAKIKEYYRRRVGEEGQGLQSDTDNEDRGPKLLSPFHVVGLWSVAAIIEQNLFVHYNYHPIFYFMSVS